MAHESWTISAFKGEAQNQPGRITKRPDIVLGDFDRTGGISPLPYMYTPAFLNERVAGYDWLGVSATAQGTNVFLRDAQSGNANTIGMSLWFSAKHRFYVPGAGVYSLSYGSSTPLDPRISDSAYVQANGVPIHIGALFALYDPSITVVSTPGSTIPAFTGITVVVVYFMHTPHGLAPVGLRYAEDRTTATGQGFQIEVSPPLTPDYVMHVYVSMEGAHAPYQWHRLYAGPISRGAMLRPPNGVLIDNSDDVPFNAYPVFYGATVQAFPNLGYMPSQYTMAAGRAFYIASATDLAFGLLAGNGVLASFIVELDEIIPSLTGDYSRQHVFYTDAGHLAFSDYKYGPRVLKFDDRILALTPSVRGIYAFSEVGTWEAYGDFESTSNTRISLVPVLGGVDDDKVKVTFSGDTAFFVKEDIIHAIGPGGVKQVGRPVFLNRPVVPPTAIWYDRFARRLLALFHDTVAVYDPNTNNWRRWPYQITPTHGEPFIFNIAEDDWWVEGMEVIQTGTPPAGSNYPTVGVEYRKLDFGLPDLRKRLHLITFAYDGSYNTAEVYIRPNGTGAWLACNVLDQGGYFEARCPTPTFRHVDVRIAVTTDDRHFAINPPLVFTFTRRGKKYHAR